MKKILFLCVFIIPTLLWAKKEITVTQQTANKTLSEAVDYHITSATTPIAALVSVNIAHEDAWLFFDNIRPSVVLSDIISHIKINGQPFEKGVNGRVAIYKHGAIIIPQGNDFEPLTVFTKRDFGGDATRYNVAYHKDLGAAGLSIHSFKLKRGYMVTMATAADGTGYSRCFIADTEDLQFDTIPLLGGHIQFMRVIRWNWPNKKAWAGGHFIKANLTQCTSLYDWSGVAETTDDIEWVNMRSKLTWPGFNTLRNKENVTHFLHLNEPDHPEQHKDDNGGKAVTVDQAIAEWPELLKSGMRLGAPSCTSFGWVYDFIEKCDSLNYRVDYVGVHCYWGGKSAQSWYNDLKYISNRCGGRPLWITEWNNGANWTTEGGWQTSGSFSDDTESAIAADQAKQLADMKKILNVLDTASFIERYFIYNAVEDKRSMALTETECTPAGEYYRDNKPILAYRPEKEYIPTYHLFQPVMRTVVFDVKAGTTKIVWNNPNDIVGNTICLERQKNNDAYETVYETTNDATVQYIDSALHLQPGKYKYRIKIISDMVTEPVYSEPIEVTVNMAQQVADMRYGAGVYTDKNTYYYQYAEPYGTGNRSVICGTLSNDNNLVGMMAQVKSENANGMTMELQSWYDKQAAVVNKTEIAPYLSLLTGTGTIGELSYEAGRVIGANQTTPKLVTFQIPFESTPVVFVRATTLYTGYPVVARVQNVTNTGFEVLVTTEEGTTVSSNTVSFIAIEQGSTIVDNKKITVNSGVHTATIKFDDTYENPFFFIGMQTRNDERTSTLRFKNLTNEQVTITKHLATTPAGTSKVETNGWLIMGDMGTNVSEHKTDDRKIYVRDGYIYMVDNTDDYKLYTLAGSTINKHSYLQPGVYIVKFADGQNRKIVVR